MTDRVTINEIARIASLSIATVSRAMNPATQHLVKRSTANRILSIIKKERYTPSLPAKRLATGKSYTIVIFFKPDFRSAFYNDYYGKMIAGSMNAVESTDYNLLVSLIHAEKGPFDIQEALKSMDAAGAVLCNFMGVFNLSAKNIFNFDIPVLIINQYQKEKNPNCFLIDNFTGAYDATVYLIRKGHKRIGFVRGTPAVKDAQDRYSGYRKALKDNDIKYEEALLYQGNFEEGSGIAAAHYFFKGRIKPPSAVFSANDVMAIGMINELRMKFKVECPRDISVIGFDGIDAGRYTTPPLTSVRQPIYEMARDAVKEIMDIAERRRECFKGTRYFKAKIIERGSVLSYP